MGVVPSPVMGPLFLAGATAPTPTGCMCAIAKLKGGRCPACKIGFIASVKIQSEMLFEALDADGRDVDPVRISSATCKKAIAAYGFCDQRRMGIVHRQAYLSRRTYHLAKGEPRTPNNLACSTCKKNAR